jgi:hypothetical protein
MYEHFAKPLLPKKKFYFRVLLHTLSAFLLVFISLFIGILGYHFWGNLSYVDSLLNASMILGGMGPVNEMSTVTGKIFSSIYALFSGIIFLVIAGLLFAPVYHRFLHKFHIGR